MSFRSHLWSSHFTLHVFSLHKLLGKNKRIPQFWTIWAYLVWGSPKPLQSGQCFHINHARLVGCWNSSAVSLAIILFGIQILDLPFRICKNSIKLLHLSEFVSWFVMRLTSLIFWKDQWCIWKVLNTVFGTFLLAENITAVWHFVIVVPGQKGSI